MYRYVVLLSLTLVRSNSSGRSAVRLSFTSCGFNIAFCTNVMSSHPHPGGSGLGVRGGGSGRGAVGPSSTSSAAADEDGLPERCRRGAFCLSVLRITPSALCMTQVQP